jgi:imidazolonepropionase-like amidohydrolase
LLIEYWERHGRPALVTTVPGAPTSGVSIEARGADVIELAETTLELRRYLVRGVAWGLEVVWLDEQGRLAAIFTRANILPLDGIRTDLLEARPQLEALAVGAYMDQLARTSETIEPLARGAFALVGARLIDGTESGTIDDSVVVVRDGRIAAVGTRADTPVPAGIEVIDAAGATIIPGLWDMHAHAAQIEWAPAYLAAGVTTVRDMGGGFAFLTAFRDTLASGRGVGPRLLLAGLVDGDNDNAFGEVTAATPEEGRAVVDRYHAAGFEQMKLYTYLQPDVVRAITARAHELGMTVTGHVPRALSLPEALDAGMDQVAHLPLRGDPASPQAEQIIEALLRHGAAVDPTASWGELLGRSRDTPIADFQPGILGAPWPIAAAYDSVRNEATPEAVGERLRGSLAGVRALYDAGVPILAGTDYGVPAHSLHRELELYVMAGLTPLEAIRAATVIPAQVMGLAEDSGTIEVGKRADMLVLDGDPLTDISAVRNGRWVVAGGVMYACEPLWEMAGFTPDPARTP